MGMNNGTTGEKIKRLRQKNNMMQSELAEYLSVTNGAISNWENNRRLPSIEELKNIAECFEVSLDYFADVASPYKIQSEFVLPSRTEKKVISYLPSTWTVNTMNQLFIFASLITLFISGMVSGNLAIFFFFYGLFSLIFYLIHSFTQINRNALIGKSIQIDINWHVVYVHKEQEEFLKKKKRQTMIALSLSGIIDVSFLSLLFYLLYQDNRLFITLILIFYFIALSFVEYYSLNTLHQSKIFSLKLAFSDVKNQFNYKNFHAHSLFHLVNVLFVALMVILCEFDDPYAFMSRLVVLLASLGFVLSYRAYILFNRTCQDYQIVILDQHEKVVPIERFE
jgi:transcriptional regulator with XRE-family HTH domain